MLYRRRRAHRRVAAVAHADGRAVDVQVAGVVQGVGFRPFVYRLAAELGLQGWVCNGERGVEIHVEGDATAIAAFGERVRTDAPAAAAIAGIETSPAAFEGFADFRIRESRRSATPTTRISPDLPVCSACLAELFDPSDRRFGYPYINCTNCGPRYSIVLALPYDRAQTTMRAWPMCAACRAEYDDPRDRRFHAQPLACAACGPSYYLREGETVERASAAVARAATLLAAGALVAVKGLGGYHLACDARSEVAVETLRRRKFRKERPFALMTADLAGARKLARLSPSDEALLVSAAHPIVLAERTCILAGVAPDNAELGLMLPYTPLQHLLFAAGAPAVLVMTSANRSNEPIAFRDDEALASLGGIADAFLIGERPIARRIDDSIARVRACEPTVLRRARGYAPQAVATLPISAPLLAVGADLKNALTLVVNGQAFGSQHIGDLEHYAAFDSFRATIADLCDMYKVSPAELTVVHDLHPQYASTQYAASLGARRVGVQHHRAHVGSVLAERGVWKTTVLGVAFDGTGYGDDGTIWGGEFFTGSLTEGFERVAHLRPAPLPGGDAAARAPVQAAAGFLHGIPAARALDRAPFEFPVRYERARKLVDAGVRSFQTTSIGRLFDTVAAIAGYTRDVTFEAQAAIWLEHCATGTGTVEPYPFPFARGELDYRPLLENALADRRAGRPPAEIAAAFHGAVARAVAQVAQIYPHVPVVLSGGVFQNRLLVDLIVRELGARVWTNHLVPPNDGGISLGQAALAVHAEATALQAGPSDRTMSRVS